MAADHVLGKEHGQPSFSASAEPVLRIAPGTGETISFETDDAAYAQIDERRDLAKVDAVINPVTGPVFVEGAEPGDTLAVTVHDIDLAPYGWSIYIPGAGALTSRMGEEFFVRQVPVTDGVVHLTDALSCPVRPMVGCVGVAAADVEASTVMPSRPTGGNMDLTDAAPGNTVFLPVAVPGALLSIGDIHAVMSRGESSFVAIEAAGVATVSVDLLRGGGPTGPLAGPRLETPDEHVVVGLGDPVQASVAMAYEGLFDLLRAEYGLSADDAYVLMSAQAHTELGGPTGSVEPDPLHPFTAIGAVTLARIRKDALPLRVGG